MSTIFNNVSLYTKANIYYNGKVTSRTVIFDDGTENSLGIMLPGEYTFKTNEAETMEIIQGYLEVKLPDSDEWQTIISGRSFEVPANSSFEVKVGKSTFVDYCCSYR